MIAIMLTALADRLFQLDHSLRRYEAGAFLFRQGDVVRFLHLVREGEIHLVRHRLDGGEAMTLQRAGAGAIVAEASIYSECYHCDCIAAKPSQIVAFAGSVIRDALAVDRDFAAAWAEYLAGEVRLMRCRAEFLGFRGVSERLDAWLALNDGRLPAKGGWKMVAAEIAVSPEALYRELSRRRKAAGGVLQRKSAIRSACQDE